MLTRDELIAFCLTFPNVYEDYPFDEEWTVMRSRLNKKSFAFIYERNGYLCVNVKCEPMEAEFLRSVYPAVMPAYHMNKTHWNTIIIDGSMQNMEIFEMIQKSYDRIIQKKKHRIISGS